MYYIVFHYMEVNQLKVIGLLNQKGGVAKTTTASVLAYGLAKRGYRVLAIDMDSQGNLTTLFKVNPDIVDSSLYEVMTKKVSLPDAIITNAMDGVDLLPSSPDVAALDMQLINEFRRENILAKHLKDVSDLYDYAIIDTPPALALMTINAVVACDYVIIPTDTSAFSVRGMQRLAETLKSLHECNEKLKILGVLIVRNRANTNMSKYLSDTISAMVADFDTTVFKTRIRDQVAVAESQLCQENLLSYLAEGRKSDKQDAGTDYESFVDEVIARISDFI